MAIACMNVKFSPNLGDGLLSECLETALRDHGAAPATTSIDLAGRTSYGQQMRGRGAIMSVLDSLPDRVRGLAIRLPLAIQARRKWGPHYAAGLDGVAGMAIGGGNLLSDLDLNFPTKLALAKRQADRLGIPVAIYACGMGRDWSAEGLRRIRAGLSGGDLRAVFLRDRASKDLWDRLLAPSTGIESRIARDPGLMASEVWPAEPAQATGRIGVGIMSYIAIRYHGSAGLDAAALGRWYLDLVDALRSEAREVVVFTNGSSEDVALLNRLRPSLPSGVAVENPETPSDLARLIAGCAGIVAHRMHAVIAAYSYGVPALALAWDGKLASFMASVDLSDWLRDAASLPARDAARLIVTAAGQGIDPEDRRRVLAEARADVGQLLAALSDQAARPDVANARL